jgi:flagella basal body P-ring formation protein FlgA
MRMKTFFFVCALIFSLRAKPCQIVLYEHVFHIGEKSSLPHEALIEKSNCPMELQDKIFQLAVKSQGILRANYLKEALAFENLDIKPKKVDLFSLENSLGKKLGLPDSWRFENLKLLNKSVYFHGKDFQVTCSNCNSLGKKLLVISILGRTFWLEGFLKIQGRVFVSKSIIPNNTILSTGDFDIQEISMTNPEEYFPLREIISFYRTNLDIPKGVPLKKSFARKMDLVTPGLPVKLRLRKNGLVIKGSGIPISGGKIDDPIKVKTKTGSFILGKVVGPNEVMVE